MAELAKIKGPISCKALLKPPKDQKPPSFTGGFIPNKQPANKVYSFSLSKLDTLFDEMLSQKAIDTPPRHKLPKAKEVKGITLRITLPTVVSFSGMLSRKH